jgi:hypothetical protein
MYLLKAKLFSIQLKLQIIVSKPLFLPIVMKHFIIIINSFLIIF